MKPTRAWLSRALVTTLALALLLTGLPPGTLAAGVPPDDGSPGSTDPQHCAGREAAPGIIIRKEDFYDR